MTIQSACNCPVYGGQTHHNTGCSVGIAPLSSTANPAPVPLAGTTFATGGWDPALSCGHEAEIARLRAALELVTNRADKCVFHPGTNPWHEDCERLRVAIDTARAAFTGGSE